MNWRSELRRTWAMFGPATASDRIVTYVVGHTNGGLALRLHVDDRGGRHLFIPDVGRSVITEVRTESLTSKARRIVFDGAEESVLDVCCSRPQLFEVFDELLVSVLDAASVAEDPVAATAEVVSQWRELLRGRASQGLSYEREIGLYAELWALAGLASGGYLDIEWWRGPFREPKDIVCPAVWIEVKGVGQASTTCTVDGLAQLEDVPGTSGYLAVVEVVEDPSGGGLDEIVEVVRSRASASADKLDERLLVAGWDVSVVGGRRWSVSDFHLVDAMRCPRLTRDMLNEPLAAGIHTVRYAVELSLLRAVSQRDAETFLRTMLTPTS